MPGMSSNDELQDLLRRLSRETPRQARSMAERELTARFRKRRRERHRVWLQCAQIAAALLIAAGLFWASRHGRVRTPTTGVEPARFMELPYAQSGVPLEGGVIVRVRFSTSELGAMGMASMRAAGESNVNAEFLVGQDGVARAVRLVE